MLVAVAKIHTEEQALDAGTKQSRQPDEAFGPACFVLYPLLVLAMPSGFLPTNIP
jgi:hypothetical protein